jgi:NOL1/NOP2/fmu family ribosome biogenesis protein
VRFWPHRVRGEGDFVALLRRESGEVADSAPQRWNAASQRVQSLWRSFAAELFSRDPALDRPLAMRGDQLYVVPARQPAPDGLRVLRAGLWLGTQRGERFEPSHSLALALRPEETGQRTTYLDFEPDDERLHRYLAGHPLDEPGENGWLLITVSGYPLGWGRRTQGIVKNYYPKGLRRTGT